MQQIKDLLNNRGKLSTSGGGAKKPTAHYFQQVALDCIAKMGTQQQDKSRVFQAFRRDISAAQIAFENTMRAENITNRTLYFLDLFNRATGKTKKEVRGT